MIANAAGHRDMAGIGEGERQQAQQIAHQHEEEQREDEGEEPAAFFADLVDAHLHDEFVADLGRRLQPTRHHRLRPHAIGQQRQHQHRTGHHPRIRLGEVHRLAEQTPGMVQPELAQRIDRPCVGSATYPVPSALGRHQAPNVRYARRPAQKHERPPEAAATCAASDPIPTRSRGPRPSADSNSTPTRVADAPRRWPRQASAPAGSVPVRRFSASASRRSKSSVIGRDLWPQAIGAPGVSQKASLANRG